MKVNHQLLTDSGSQCIFILIDRLRSCTTFRKKITCLKSHWSSSIPQLIQAICKIVFSRRVGQWLIIDMLVRGRFVFRVGFDLAVNI